MVSPLAARELKAHVKRVHGANYGVYGARKVWLALNREDIEAARCTVEGPMGELGSRGAARCAAWPRRRPSRIQARCVQPISLGADSARSLRIGSGWLI